MAQYLEQIECANLTNEELGALFRAMMQYQFRGEEPEELSNVAQVFWAFIRTDLDHARERYETSVKNGRKGGRKKKEPNETQQNPEEGKSITESISESISITESIPNTESMPSAAAEDLSVSKKVYGEYGWILLSDQEYDGLQNLMGSEELQKCITYIDESAQSTGNRNHWLDWCAVLRRCYQRGWHRSVSLYPRKEEIPKGASGELGPIELEAIHRLLRER